MLAKISSAVGAYTKALSGGAKPGMEPRDGQEQNFAGALAGSLDKLRGALKAGETASTAAVMGKADLTHLVTAVSNAELTLQTVVGVRDRAIQAYQEISRMPI
ncbi:MAG: flagellar hook-basal body complex protein FliE [Alphaproteobacteria bacterium]